MHQPHSEELLKSIQVTDTEIENAINKHKSLRDSIDKEFHSRTMLTGSYKRNTGVNPLNDVDVFLWLPKDYIGIESITEIRSIEPKKILEKVKRKLKSIGVDNESIVIQTHSLGIKFQAEDFSIDLIPAFSKEDPNEGIDFNRIFYIPETDSDSWIIAEPEKDRVSLSIANNKGKKKVVPTIKLFKHWRNCQNEKTFKSFQIESLCRYLAEEPSSTVFNSGKNLFETYLDASKEIMRILNSKTPINNTINLRKDPLKLLYSESKRYDITKRKVGGLIRRLEKIEDDYKKGNYERSFDDLGNLFSVSTRALNRGFSGTKVNKKAPEKRFG